MTAYKAQSWNLYLDKRTGIVTIDVLARGQCVIGDLTKTEDDLRNPALALYSGGERVELATVACNTSIDLGTPSQAGVVLSGILGPGKWRLVAERIG